MYQFSFSHDGINWRRRSESCPRL